MPMYYIVIVVIVIIVIFIIITIIIIIITINLNQPIITINLNQANFFIPNIRQGLRSHELSIVVPRTTTSAFKFAFAQRRIAQWNALPSHVAGARTLSHFKELISSYVI